MRSDILLLLIAAIASKCPDEKFCLTCANKPKEYGICNVCEKGFLDTDNNCSQNVSLAIPNCFTYQSILDEVVCKKCEFGFRVSDDFKQCIACQEGCASCFLDADK